jgi:polar amino acid transport system substrate-binding protein
MKKMIALVLVLVMAAAFLTACGGSGVALADVQKAGKLVIATSPDFPPFENLENGEVVGIEIDIMNLICDQMGVELVIEQMDFESVIPGIQAGKFDAGVSGITVTEDRKKNVDFSDPYFLASQAIVVTPDSPITCKADLTGKKISVQTGTTAEEYCMDEGYTVLAFTANNDAASALTSGKVDAWVVDNEVAVALAAEQGLVVLDEAMTSEPYAFAFPKGSDTLVAEINKIIAELIADGTIQGLFDDYGVLYVSPVG